MAHQESWNWNHLGGTLFKSNHIILISHMWILGSEGSHQWLTQKKKLIEKSSIERYLVKVYKSFPSLFRFQKTNSNHPEFKQRAITHSHHQLPSSFIQPSGQKSELYFWVLDININQTKLVIYLWVMANQATWSICSGGFVILNPACNRFTCYLWIINRSISHFKFSTLQNKLTATTKKW